MFPRPERGEQFPFLEGRLRAKRYVVLVREEFRKEPAYRERLEKVAENKRLPLPTGIRSLKAVHFAAQPPESLST